MFDEFAAAVLETTGEPAERIRMIGQDVQNVQLKQMQEAATVYSVVADQSLREMIEAADLNALVVIKDLRDAAKAAEESLCVARPHQRPNYGTALRALGSGPASARKPMWNVPGRMIP